MNIVYNYKNKTYLAKKKKQKKKTCFSLEAHD